MLMTYRTFIAFFSDSKSVLININKFGEQYFDLFALIIIWIISLVGLIILILMLREEKALKKSQYKPDKRTIIEQNRSFLDIDNNLSVNLDKSKIKGVIVEPVKNFDEEINLKN